MLDTDSHSTRPAIVGQILAGKFGEIIARKISSASIELGEIVIAESDTERFFMSVYDLEFGSQVSRQNLELISGFSLEEETQVEFLDNNIRNYTIAYLKNLVTVDKSTKKITTSKNLPKIFSSIRKISSEDMDFLTRPKHPLFIGFLRSGSSALDFPIYLDGEDVLTHHVLISGTTGKGKSVLMSDLLWDMSSKDYCSTLVLDPHDEYFGKNTFGIKDHPKKAIYYTPKNPPIGARTLKINLKLLRPQHFGCLDFSDAQEQAMNAYYKEYGTRWIESIVLDKSVKVNFIEATVGVVKRRLMYLLDLDFNDEQLFCNGVFDMSAGEGVVKNICEELEATNTVIVDTSSFSGQVELLIGSIVTSEIFYRYKQHKLSGILKDKPVISIVLEEAPRVLGKEVLEKNSNIFSTIAREGRKFKVGLIAITQLPSLIPREILANMNTKIILGTDMINERQAIIDSASQDLTSDSRAIASLDRGECIISSNFASFALPVKMPLFEEWAKKDLAKRKETNSSKPQMGFDGVDIK